MSDLVSRDQASVWHPFTQAAVAPPPIPIARGKGVWLYDTEGKAYLDMISSWWVNAHGHSHPRLNAALARQAETLEHALFAGFTHEPAVRLAEQLAELMPAGLSRTFFSDNGSTAVEVALKLAYQYWRNQGDPRRNRFLALKHAYHGDTFGAMAAGKKSGFFQHFEELFFAVDFIELPERWEEREDLAEAEQATLAHFKIHLERHGHNTAALILEPLVQGAGGMRMYSLNLLNELIALARQYGILVIFDEVMTGFGRTGHLFVCQAVEQAPDIVCLSKILTAGYLPMAVNLVREELYQAFLGDSFSKGFAHGHSYTGNPLGCALALENLAIFREEGVMARIRAMEDWHRELFAPLKRHSAVQKLRIQGTIAAFELASVAEYGGARSKAAERYFVERGFIIRPLGKVIYLLPPYCLSKDELASAVAVIEEFLNTE